MKKLILLALIFLLPSKIHAQESDDIRNWTSLTFSMIGKKCSKKENRVYNQKGHPKWKEYSLKDESPKKLNSIEKKLLMSYEDVIITKFSRGYFLVQNDAIGVASRSGKILIEPINGKVRVVAGGGYSNLHIFGEQTSDFDIWNNMFQIMADNANYDIAIPVGLFKGVAIFTNPDGFKGVIPSGKYDFISLVLRSKTGLSGRNTGYYVYKQQGNGELLCGYCDNEGNEIIPCKYKSIYFDGNDFVGDNTKTMLEWNEVYINKMNLKKEQAEQKRAEWASALNSFGNAMMGVASTMNGPTSTTYSESGSVSTKTSSKSNKSVSEMTSRNTAYKAYEGYANELMKMANGQIEYSNSQRKKYQAEMKNIRTKWIKKGYEFTKLSWEDWSGL